MPLPLRRPASCPRMRLRFSFKLTHEHLKSGAVVPDSKRLLLREKRVRFWLLFFTAESRLSATVETTGSGSFELRAPLDTLQLHASERVHVWLFASNPYRISRDTSYTGDFTVRIATGWFSLLSASDGKEAQVALCDTVRTPTARLSVCLERTYGNITVSDDIDKETAGRRHALNTVISRRLDRDQRTGWKGVFSLQSNVPDAIGILPTAARHYWDNVPIWLWVCAHTRAISLRSRAVLEKWTESARCFSDAEFMQAPPDPASTNAAEFCADLIALFPRSLAYVRDAATRGLNDEPSVEFDDWLHPEFHPVEGMMGVDCEDAAISALHTAHSIRYLPPDSKSLSPWLRCALNRERSCITFFAVGTLKITKEKYTWHAYLLQLDASWIAEKTRLDLRRVPPPLLYSESRERLLPGALIECTTVEGAAFGVNADSFHDDTMEASIRLPQEPVPPLSKGRAETLHKNNIYPHTMLLFSPLLTEYLGVEHILLKQGGRAGAATGRLLAYDDTIEMEPALIEHSIADTEAALQGLIQSLPPTAAHRTPGKPLEAAVTSGSGDSSKGIQVSRSKKVALNVFYREADFGPWIPKAIEERLGQSAVQQEVRKLPVSGSGADIVNVRVFRD